jgi:hypothetical protein
MADDLKFRECLVAEHPSLEGFLTCPHLTKPVFAMWLLAAEGRALAADQLQLRLRGFLIELFHRAGVGFAWAPADYVRPIDEVVDSLVDSLGVKAVLSDPLSMGTTRVQASAKAIPSLMEPFSFVALPPETIMHLPRLDLDGVRDFRHYQFTYQAALDVFRGLGVASSCPEFAAENTVLDLARQLQVAKTSNNIERNSAVYYATPMTEVRCLPARSLEACDVTLSFVFFRRPCSSSRATRRASPRSSPRPSSASGASSPRPTSTQT